MTLQNEKQQYYTELKKNLSNYSLFIKFKKMIDELREFFDNEIVSFPNSNEGIFAKVVMHRVCEESLAYIGCLEKGAFFASNHHSRALIELYAVTVLIADEKEKKKRYLERFIRYPEIEFYKEYHNDENAIFKLPKEILEEFFPPYAELDKELLKVYNKNNKKELLEMRSWRGAASIEDLLNKLPHSTHKKNYDKMCLFTHFSSIVRASELKKFPSFDENKNAMLAITMKYVNDIYIYLRGNEDEKFFNKEMVNKLDDIFLKVVPDLYSKITSMQKK